MDVKYLSEDEQRLTRSQGNILEYSLLFGHVVVRDVNSFPGTSRDSQGVKETF